MLNFELISTIIGILGGTGVLIAGGAYGFTAWKKGSNTYKDENIADLKETVYQKDIIIARLNEDKTNLIANHQLQINDMVKQLAKLQAQLDEQGKKLVMYSEILENRDPQTRCLLEEIKTEMMKMNQHQIFQEKNVKEVAVKAETVRIDLKAKKGVKQL